MSGDPLSPRRPRRPRRADAAGRVRRLGRCRVGGDDGARPARRGRAGRRDVRRRRALRLSRPAPAARDRRRPARGADLAGARRPPHAGRRPRPPRPRRPGARLPLARARARRRRARAATRRRPSGSASGAIPAAVPHTRPVPILGTESAPGLLGATCRPGPAGILRVPVARWSRCWRSRSPRSGVPARRLLRPGPALRLGPVPGRLGRAARGRSGGTSAWSSPTGDLAEEARQLRTRLDAATALEETTRTYVERLEAMVDEQRLPSGDDLISEIERFLRDRGGEGTQRLKADPVAPYMTCSVMDRRMLARCEPVAWSTSCSSSRRAAA